MSLLEVLLFAIGIVATITLHEWGHFVAARPCGTRVRRYFIGFDLTLFSFRRHYAAAGEHSTERGVKAIPFGGFCDIAGMTITDPVDPVGESYATCKKPWQQRVIVMSGGVAMNLVVGFIIPYFIAVTWGLSNMSKEVASRIQAVQCVASAQRADGTLEPCTDSGSAERAGLCVGDMIERINDARIMSYPEAVFFIGSSARSDIKMAIDRNDSTRTVMVTPGVIKYETNDGQDIDQSVIGIAFQRSEITLHKYNTVTIIGGMVSFVDSLFGTVWNGLLSIPKKVPDVVASIFGVQRDPTSPTGVAGASRTGDGLVGMNRQPSFFLLLASLNHSPTILSLVPLPPPDGDHTAVVVCKRTRDLIRRAFGKSALGLVDYTKLVLITVASTTILLVFGVLVMVTDVANPIVLNH